MSFLGAVMFYALRSDLSFAIVCMVKPSISTDSSLNETTISKAKCNETSSFLTALTSSGNSNKPEVKNLFFKNILFH